jgi:hypothetical protein
MKVYVRITQISDIFMIDTPKNENKIKEFLGVFKTLSGDEKIYFLAQIDKILSGKNEKDRKIFLALLKAAKDGKSYEETMLEMKKV